MAGQIRVTPEELESMSYRYSSEADKVGEQVNSLNEVMSQLKSMWEGESSRAFEEQYETLKPSFYQMQQLLEDVSTQLKSTARSLDEADNQIANQIRG
ncbi:WXG100 family type VII secretion target [Bacillus sp. NTK071]|uniref:WXG100 family type VII secretion target n=1 Tax=Bacillus sp. NTK071 TaxID=2802175 RepID=UPI001A8E1499|nr:WXG100 family type VII secretion target [Bacillus sp. NTK071]MBN8209406.1 WXG100 family type VII secretion target [Bacillus sp. NTK071]